MANKINVLECGPRDGWQNLKQMLTFEQKLDLIDRLFDAGVTQMEVTSFVSPKAIPQMADAADLAVFLPDYRESRGAMVEWAYCQRIGKDCALYLDMMGGKLR